jgi:hypothetical protein
MDKGNLGAIESFWVQSNFVTVYNSLFFHLAYPFQYSRWGKADLSGNFDVWNTGLPLKYI